MFQRLCLIFLVLSLCLLGCARKPTHDPAPVMPAVAPVQDTPKVTPIKPAPVAAPTKTVDVPIKNSEKALAPKVIKTVELPKPQPVIAVPSARIIFYRETKFVGSALNYDIYERQNKRASLQNGSYFVLEVMPGKHSFYMREVNPSLPALNNSSEAPQVLTLDIKAGETRYIKGGVETGIMSGHAILTPASETEAKLNLGKLLDAR